MKIRVLAIFASLIFVSAAIATDIPADIRPGGGAAGEGGVGASGVLPADAAHPSQEPSAPLPQAQPGEFAAPPEAPGATPVPDAAAEVAPDSPVPETSLAPEGQPAEGPEGNAEEPVREEEVPAEEAAQPPVPGRPALPLPGPPSPFPLPRATPPPAPSAGPVPPAQVPGREAGGGFLVKFNNADIYEVIHTLGRMAGINYLIDPRVRGVVNVHTQGTVRKEGALELLFSILKINGATAVREGDLYHIVPMAEAKMEPLLPEERIEKKGDVSPNRPVMRAFPLQYIAAAEMAKVIKPFVSAAGDVTEVPRANMVLVMDTEGNMEKHARLVELFDADAFRAAGVKMFPLKFLDPEEMAKNLESIFGALDFGAKGGKPSGINFVPLPRMNALLVVTASPKTMENIERWIAELDKEPSGTARTVYLYRVRHGKVEDVMAVLNRLFPGKVAPGAGKPTEFRPKVAEPAARPATPVPRQEEKPAAAGPGGAVGGTDTFDIIPDAPTNSIIIRGSASEYAAFLNVLKVIDVYPLQVLLEVLIAEVQLDDELRLGVEWRYLTQSGSWSHDLRAGIPPESQRSQGLIYAFEKTNRLMGSIRALADDGKVSILSSPSVISTNGKESKIEVAQQVPVTTGQVTNVAGAADVITETVEYRDVGIILSFTPYINDEGLITLEISQNVSEVASATGGALNNPIFLKRSIQTTLLATQDRSIVLGGLVQERRERSRDGIPFLYKIPVFGWIFGSRSSTVARTELLIFITPRVIESVEEGTQLSREFEDRVKELKRRISEAEGLKPQTREPQRGGENP